MIMNTQGRQITFIFRRRKLHGCFHQHIYIVYEIYSLQSTVKPVFSGHSKRRPKIGFQSMKDGKDQDSIQSSTTPDPGYHTHSGPCSAVGNVSGYRCVSDCRSRGGEFDPGLVPYFRGDWSWNNFYGHSPPFRWFIQEGLLSVTSESMCTNYWLTACSSLPRKKCGEVNWPSRNDHSCWHGM